MRLLVWALRAFVFFGLFAFALNNQQETTIHWFFGFEWRAPMVIVVLAAFTAGCAIGVLAMLPSWWRHRRVATQKPAVAAPAPLPTTRNVPSGFGAEAGMPPREHL
jgi:putative membrane protein